MSIYRIFISHAWKYDAHYTGLVNLLKADPWFEFRNYSVPQHDPLINPGTEVGKRKLLSLLDEQIRQVNVFLVIAAMYAAHRPWIQDEINIAKQYGKTIIGVKPLGQERIPHVVDGVANYIVGWRTNSIVEAIKIHSR